MMTNDSLFQKVMPETTSTQQPIELNGEQILELVTDKTTIGTFADLPLNYAVYIAPDGQLYGRFNDGQKEWVEHGTWRVEGNKLMGRWERLKNGAESGFRYRYVGTNIHAIRDDGSLDRIQFFILGDPMGLACATATASDSEQQVRAAVDAWVELWNANTAPIDEARFTRYTHLFARGDNYLAVDDFTGQVLTIRGYHNYIRTWVPVMKSFASWRIALVDDVPLQALEDTYIATIKFKGDGRLKDGKEVSSYTYGTLVWHRFGEGWRLVHEHLTGGTQ
jgi:ketosteroid isomerase-like protein